MGLDEFFNETWGCFATIASILFACAVVNIVMRPILAPLDYWRQLYKDAEVLADTNRDRITSLDEQNQMYLEMGLHPVEGKTLNWYNVPLSQLEEYVNSHQITVPEETPYPEY